jgi:hypothetical protein
VDRVEHADEGTLAQVHPEWDTLLDRLNGDRAAILAAMVQRAREELPAYAELPSDALVPGFGLQFDAVLLSARSGEPVAAENVGALADIGEARALQGVPIEDMLRAWRIGIQVVIDESARISVDEAIAPAATLDFVRAILAWADVAMLATATAHRRAELQLARQDEDRRATLVRGLLFGTLPMAEVRDELRAYGLDPAGEYVAVRARPSAAGGGRALDAALGFLDAAPYRSGMRVTLDGDVAGFLRERPTKELSGTVGVGPPRTLDQLADSFRLATRAFVCAGRFALDGIHSIEDLGLLASIADDRDVGDALTRRYIAPLGDGNSGLELAATLRAYFDCAMNVERAAEQLYVHANTVRYRINRFEEQTGAKLREPGIAFEVWWALQRSAMKPPDPG